MAIIQNLLPPSRENWELINSAWQFFPVFAAVQWFTSWYPQGKTSMPSRFNLPGKWAWFIMESPGFLTLLYIVRTLPHELALPGPLPWGNRAMAAMFTLHYAYRAVAAPLFLNPSMAPISPLIVAFATCWQLANATCIGGWLGGHGPRTAEDWAGRAGWAVAGMVVWGVGLLGNVLHDDELREIRRAAARKEKGKEGERVYMVPENGLFGWVLYAHYLCEWVEWAGFWMVGGLGCTPARSFLLNEVSTMLPRAVQGKRWYVEKFGAEKVGARKAVIPGLI